MTETKERTSDGSGEGKTLIARIPKSMVVREDKASYWADLGSAEDMLKMCMLAIANPNKAVIERDGKAVRVEDLGGINDDCDG